MSAPPPLASNNDLQGAPSRIDTTTYGEYPTSHRPLDPPPAAASSATGDAAMPHSALLARPPAAAARKLQMPISAPAVANAPPPSAPAPFASLLPAVEMGSVATQFFRKPPSATGAATGAGGDSELAVHTMNNLMSSVNVLRGQLNDTKVQLHHTSPRRTTSL